MELLVDHVVQNGESDEDTVSFLRNEIRKRDEDIHVAATIGKQLLEEKQVLDSKFSNLLMKNDDLEQEKHVLQIELENLKQTLKCHSSEVDNLHDKFDNVSKEYADLQREHSIVLAKMASLNKENQDMKRDQEDKQLENNSLKNKIQLQEEQIKMFQNQVEVSLLDITMDDGLQLKEDLDMYVKKNKDLQDAFSECQYELETLKVKERRLNEIIKNLKEEIDFRDNEIASYSVEVKKSKEEMAELQEEVEIMRLKGVDFNKKGNSVFAEVDDRRKHVEKQFLLVCGKFERMKKDYEEKKQQLYSTRMQMASLLCMKSFEHQQSYINNLQSELKKASMEIRSLTIKLHKISKHQLALDAENKELFIRDEYSFLRTLLKQAQEKEENLQNELIKERVKNIALNEKLIEIRESLYQASIDLDICKKENVKIQNELKGLETLQTLERNYTAKVEKMQNIEILPDFQATDKSMLNSGKNQSLDLENGRTVSDETILGKDCCNVEKSPKNSNKLVSNSTPGEERKECNAQSKVKLNESDAVTDHQENFSSINTVLTKDERGYKNDNCTHQ